VYNLNTNTDLKLSGLLEPKCKAIIHVLFNTTLSVSCVYSDERIHLAVGRCTVRHVGGI